MDGLVSQGHQEPSWVKVFVGNSEPKSCFKYSRGAPGVSRQNRDMTHSSVS